MKYILVDGNNLAVRNKVVQENSFKHNGNGQFIKEAWKYMLLNSIFKIAHEHKPWVEIIFCVDSQSPWRKDIYPEYKGNREKSADGNWEEFYEAYNEIQEFISLVLPFKVLKIPRCEADDIIGVIAKEVKNSLIISSDKDMMQCLRHKNTTLYNGIEGKFITSSGPVKDLFIKICTGDKGDNIGSIATRMGEKTAEKLFDGKVEWTDIMKKLFKRNQKLIDFNYIDNNISEKILTEFKNISQVKSFDEVALNRYFELNNMNEFLNKWDTITNRLNSYCN